MIKCLTFRDSGLSDKAWDKYISSADNGTMLQKRSFLNYHKERKFEDASLVFEKKKRILALFPATLIDKETGPMLSSHAGASWGGLVCQNPLTYRETELICEQIISYARDLNCRSIEITLSPNIYQKTPSEYLSFTLLQKGFQYKKRELNSVIRLDVIDDLRGSIDKSAREEISKSSRLGIDIIRSSEEWTAFYYMLESFLSEKNKKPTHTLEELLLLKKTFPEDIDLWTAYIGDELVGGRCNWQVQPGIWLFFYCAYKTDLPSHGILTRLFYECIKDYYAKGARYIDLGTSSLNMKVNEGLVANKEHFSAYGIFRETLRYQF